MNTMERIDQLAQELASGGLTESLAERKRSELVLLLMNECNFKFEDEEKGSKEKSRFDNLYFTEAFVAALANYDKKNPEMPFLNFFISYYNTKAMGLKFDKIAQENPETFAERLHAMKALIEKIGKTEGLDYKDYKNNLRYLNKDKILATLDTWGVAEKYRDAVEAVMEHNKITYLDAPKNTGDDTDAQNPYDILPDIKREDTHLQLLLADIIEKSYVISKIHKLYPLNHCEWSGNLYENYDAVIPVVFSVYLEQGYISYYEAQKLWDILANELLGAYLNYAPDTIRKKRKQLEAINLQAWREVGNVDG